MLKIYPKSILYFFICISAIAGAQTPDYTDYIGAGHAEGIVVSTSSDLEQNGWQRHATGQRTIDGGGLDARRMEASRFLAQAGLGGSQAEIDALAESLDFEGWIDWQKDLPLYTVLDASHDAWIKAKQIAQQQGQNPNMILWHTRHFDAGLWQSLLTQPDVLRNRVALALSEIMVISTNSNIGIVGDAYAHYYDVLRKHAFGNFEDLLFDVSTHPTMGVYLTHFRNPKTNPASNTFPDENYAREIMQLFTIGLYELNTNGSVKLNAQGDPISAYGQDDIRELSKIFTGLGAGGMNQAAIDEGRTLDFNIRRGALSYVHPMLMYENFHESGPKTFLGHTIQSASGMQEIRDAIEILVNHPNTAPFVSKKLIQLLVTSNPSPGYIESVANTFNDDGNGVKGNLEAVIKKILLHEDARSCEAITAQGHGRLRTPSQRYFHFAKALTINTYQGLYWPHHNLFMSATAHFPLSSPSVFNFYLPDHQPNGPIADAGLVAPEFGIHNSTTSLGYINELDDWTRNDKMFESLDLPATASLNYQHYFPESTDPEVILNRLDVLFSHGRMSDNTRSSIRQAIQNYNTNQSVSNPVKDRLDLAVFLLLMSPDYNILK